MLLPGGLSAGLAEAPVSDGGAVGVGLVTVLMLDVTAHPSGGSPGVGALRCRAMGRHDGRDAPKIKACEI